MLILEVVLPLRWSLTTAANENETMSAEPRVHDANDDEQAREPTCGLVPGEKVH